MKEERMEILNMLKDGTISAEEAERLLRALEEGGETHNRSETRHRHSHDFGSGDFSSIRELGRAFRGFGKTFGSAMRSAASGAKPYARLDDLEDYEDVGIVVGGQPLDEESRLVVRQIRDSHGDLEAHESADDLFRVKADGSARLKRKGNEYVLVLDDDCELQVPRSCASMTVMLFDGDVTATGLSVPLSVHTMSGDIELAGVVLSDTCATMSGDIELSLPTFAQERTDVTTMSGDISVVVPGNWSGTVEASTMSGDVDLELPDARISDDSRLVGRHVRARMGDTDTPELSCSTMSGDVEVATGRDEDVVRADAE